MRRKFVQKLVSAVMIVLLMMGAMAPSLSALQAAVSDKKASIEKTDFNYVALGASNVNGYGVHGYNYESVYEAPFEKAVDNRYGYKMNTPGAYPMLIKDKLSENYNVDLSLIAMSSMRVEEIRLLLDEDYWGDSYTDTWFYDINGDGISSNWSYGAGLYEWQVRAEAGMPGYDHIPTNEEALETLRDATVISVSNADLITIDIGMNNFGTYMLNLLSDGIFSNDIYQISPEIGEFYNTVRNYVIAAIKNMFADNPISEEMLNHFADTLTYAMVGYCYNMDSVIEIIHELNPDVEIVVLSIQNMMRGLDLVYPGYDGKVPLGELFDIVVNIANLYVATLSPHSDSYYYANVSSDGHVEFLLDEIASYNGNPSTLGENIKDCFDVYDDSMFLKTRIQQKFAVLMSKENFVNIHESQMDENDIESLKAFHYGFHYDIEEYNYPIITVSDGTPLKDFLKMGEEGILDGENKRIYDTYQKMLTVGYDVISEIMREASLTDTIDLPVIFYSSALGISIVDLTFDVLDSVLDEALEDRSYSFDINERYPDGFFDSLAKEKGLPEGMLETLFCFGLRVSFAGTAFCHPNTEGYKEICDIVWNSYTKQIKGKMLL